MNNQYFEQLTQRIKAYLRFRDPTAPSYYDGGDSQSIYEDELDGGFANSIYDSKLDVDSGTADGADEYVYIYSSTDLQEVEINDNIEKLFGCFNAKTAKIKIMNPVSTSGRFRYNVSDKDVEIYFGHEEDGELVYKKKGTFRVKKPNNKTVSDNTTFELQDLSILLDTPCDIEFPYPCTRLQVVQLICAKFGLILATPDFWCSGMAIETQFYKNGATYREIIRLVAESSLCNAKIGDDDRLYIKSYNNTDYVLKPRVYKSLNVTERFGYVNRVVLAETDESGSTDYDVVIAENEESINANGISEVRISNNMILNFDREQFAPLLLGQLENFYYYGFSSEMVLGNYELDHDFITLQDKQGNRYRSILMNINYKYNGAFKSKVNSPATSKTKQEYPGAGRIGQMIKNTMLNVDKVKGLITSLNAELNDEDGIASRLTKIEQSSTSVTTIIEQSGSDNLIKNSVGYAWENDNANVPKFWRLISGRVNYVENDWTRINSLSGRAWLLRTGKIEQEISVTTGKTYTLSFLVNKLTALGTCSVSIENGSETVIYDNYMTDTEYSHTFKALGNSIKVILTANNVELYITDLLINTGDTKQQWKQASGELYTSEVLVDIDGVMIKNNLYSGYTIISPSEFAGYYLVNGSYKKVFTLNKDTTWVTKLHSEESVEIGSENNNVKTLFLAVADGLDIVLKEES
jgi:hypothetical protein